MAQELYKNLNGLRICVAGAGVTGLAVARSLTKRGVEVTLIDENKISTDEFPVVHPDAITITDFDHNFDHGKADDKPAFWIDGGIQFHIYMNSEPKFDANGVLATFEERGVYFVHEHLRSALAPDHRTR